MVGLIVVQVAPLAESFQVFVPVIAGGVVQVRDRQDDPNAPPCDFEFPAGPGNPRPPDFRVVRHAALFTEILGPRQNPRSRDGSPLFAVKLPELGFDRHACNSTARFPPTE